MTIRCNCHKLRQPDTTPFLQVITTHKDRVLTSVDGEFVETVTDGDELLQVETMSLTAVNGQSVGTALQ